MKIIVCIKQVPYCDQLKFDTATKRIIRDAVPNEINPFDKRALTKAVELRQQFGGQVIAVTMGPPQAQDALIEALAMGADRAVHIQGREFAGADTLATARTLALACKKIGFDLVFCGKYSTDAETAQVPPMLAEFLNVPQVTGVSKLEVSADASDKVRPQQLTATRELDAGFETIECVLPAVLSAAERLIKPGRATPADLEAAKQRPIEIMSAADLGADVSLLGLAGSPTWVEEIFSIEPKRKRIVRTVDGNGDAVAEEIARVLIADGVFSNQTLASGQSSVVRRPRSVGNVDNAIWVVAELSEGEIRHVTLELLGRSLELAEKSNSQVAAVLIGHNVTQHVKTLAAYGADRIYVADAPALEKYSTETFTAVLVNAIRKHKPYAVLFPSTASGRDLAPRVAARLNIGLTGDCIGLEIDEQKRLVQLKPAFGGNIVAPILTKTQPVMATVRPGMFRKPEPDFSREPQIDLFSVDDLPSSRTRVISQEINVAAGIELDDAPVVIGVGMGVGGPENLPIVQELAHGLNASIAGTRRVVDAGWLPGQVQVGLTGRSIAPRLYIGVGISGKYNHMVGVQRANVILAINNDPAADVFKHADYGIVGDWAQVVPALTRAFTRLRA